MLDDNLLTSLLTQAQTDVVMKIVVGAVIVDKTGRILLLQRAATEDFLPNFWELPSGHVDEGETLLAALTREVKEETGFEKITISSYLHHFDYHSRSGKLVRQFNFIVSAPYDVQPTLNPAEHQAYKFCNLDEAKTLGADETVLRCFYTVS